MTTSAQIIMFCQDWQALLAQQRQICHESTVSTSCLCVAGLRPAAYHEACQNMLAYTLSRQR